MNQNTDYWDKFDELLFNDGFKIADTFLCAGFTVENIFAAQKVLYSSIDKLIESFLTRTETEGQPSECKKGCAYCCHQTVLAAPYELLYMASFLKRKYNENALESVRKKLHEKSVLSSGLKLDKLLKYKKPCPLLHSTYNFCTAYQARPMACRIYLSASVESCKNDLKTPADDKVFPQLFDMPLRAGRMMNEGFQSRIRKGRISNLQVFENTIETGLLAALDNSAPDKWLKGGAVFRKIA